MILPIPKFFLILIQFSLLLALNPDVIIDIGPTAGFDAWRQYTTLSAVRNHRITAITNDYASIPGPRFVKLLSDFRKAIQP